MDAEAHALFDLVGWLEIGRPSMNVVLEGSKGLLTAMSVIGLGLVGTGATVFGGQHKTLEALGRTAVAWVILGNYEFIFQTVVGAADYFAAWIMEQGDLSGHIQRSRENLSSLWAASDDGVSGTLDRLSGLFKSGILSYSAVVTQFASFLGAQLIVFLTAVFLNMLYVLGPVLVAGSVLTNGQSLKSWGSSLFEISLWPAFPALVGLMGAHMTDNPAISAGNVAVVITVNLLTSFLILFTPLVVHLLLSRGGLATLAVAGNVIGARALMALGRKMIPSGSYGRGSGGGGATENQSASPGVPGGGGGPEGMVSPGRGFGAGGSPRRLYGSRAMAASSGGAGGAYGGRSSEEGIIDAEWSEVRPLPPGRGPRLLQAPGKEGGHA